jgi:hypothetical protein
MPVLAFDIGIKNLAFCLYDLSGEQILAWGVHSLMEDNTEEPVICSKCKAKASFKATVPTCKRHCTLQPLLVKKDMQSLLAALKEKEPAAKAKSKAKVLEALTKYYSLPIERKKPASASHATEGGGMHKIHDAIRSFVGDNFSDFSKATHILLENQPAYKNPTMKTVQILLYSELRSALLDNDFSPKIGFAHAGKKNKGCEGGDGGYADRKKQTKERVEEWLVGKASQSVWQSFYKSHKKRDDLADAFCMCQDSA